LDTTLQAQILGHLKDLQQQGLSIILISHDLGVVAQMAYRVGVMYAGSLVEITTTAELFQRPAHPYTAGLLRSVPRLDHPNRRLTAVRGTLPSLINLPDQCPFLSRCYKATSECRTSPNPALSPTGPDHLVACYNQVRHE
jgi:oligopeptide/dipeptide ABC transporter ATP-binding protein